MSTLSEKFATAGGDVPRTTVAERKSYQIFFDLLVEWNARFNLVSKGSLQIAFAAHFVDSIWIADGAKAAGIGEHIDLGSGAGFPGLVLAIRHGLPVTLFERTGKKRMFLEEVKKTLDLPVQIAEDFQGTKKVCTIMARAVLPPKELFKFLAVRVPRKSCLVLPLAKETPESLVGGRFKLEKTLPYSLPEGAGSRTVAIFSLG
ncbi:MAG: class I SAM-dependent methyltransferase [Deltaproteobacteria bacterium]|nr:class I SAM-dependent methyltransferase [Deltaproteobacteria bacterium]MBI3293744.1 class I SAM-dependent methyltransferase [Deltaproteobacteria bacterium]